jgi:CubicO group peptidase (beta-lactamase class C family)
MVTSARDYDRFLNMLANHGALDGVRVLSTATAKLAMSDLLPSAVSTDGTYADGAGFGAGGRVGKGVNAGVFGWGGAAGTVAFVDPRRKLRAVCMAQYMPSNAYPFHQDFAKWVLKDLGSPA